MKTVKACLFIAVCIITTATSMLTAQTEKNLPKGEYFGQKPPGMKPELFAPGFISTETNELNSVFHSNMKEFYFTRRNGENYFIMVTKMKNGTWKEPEIASFSGEFIDVDMCISHDGKTLYFCSRRPKPGSKESENANTIWFVERTDDEWSDPAFLDAPLNEGHNVLYPTLTYDGTMYFSASWEGNLGEADIYKSEFRNRTFLEPVNLGRPVNSEFREGDVLVAPDESFVVLTHSKRSDSFGKADLYISYRNSNDTWTEPVNLGETINTNQVEYCPMLSPDAKYFFYTSKITGNGDVYWVDARILQTFGREQK